MLKIIKKIASAVTAAMMLSAMASAVRRERRKQT